MSSLEYKRLLLRFPLKRLKNQQQINAKNIKIEFIIVLQF